MRNQMYALLFFGLGLHFLQLTIRSVRSGVVPVAKTWNTDWYRSRQPYLFWFQVVVYVSLSLIAFTCAVIAVRQS